MSFDISQSDILRAAVLQWNVAYRLREGVQVVSKPANAINPRRAKVLAVRNLREAANTSAAVIVALQPGTEATIYDVSPPPQANGFTWLFAEIGLPVQYAGYVVTAVNEAQSFEELLSEPPPDAVYSVWLTDDEIRQSVQLNTLIAQAEADRMTSSKKIIDAHLELAAILTAALNRALSK